MACCNFSTRLTESALHQVKIFNLPVSSEMSLWYRGLIPQAAMRPFSIVVVAPLFNYDLSFPETIEDFLIQALIT
jgi:hypothetical protein